MNFIDTHSHLYADQFDQDRDEVVNEAILSGVNKILLPNINKSTTNKMLDLCKKFPNNCFPMIGVHPCDVKEKTIESEMNHFKKEVAKNKYIAIGEIGIDLYWDNSTEELQKKIFKEQILIAKKFRLPVVIHTRNSFDLAIDIVEELNDNELRGVFHCFSGDEKDAQRIINLNDFYLGIGGVLTFKNSSLKKILHKINLDYLLLETDSPYLSPHPLRGKRNESKNIVIIAQEIANTLDMDLNRVADITSQNAKKLFKV